MFAIDVGLGLGYGRRAGGDGRRATSQRKPWGRGATNGCIGTRRVWTEQEARAWRVDRLGITFVASARWQAASIVQHD